MKKILFSFLSLAFLYLTILSCNQTKTEDLQPVLTDNQQFTFENDKKQLSRFSSLLHYSKLTSGKINGNEISFTAQKLENEKFNFSISKSETIITVKTDFKNPNSTVEFDILNKTVKIQTGAENVTLLEGYDPKKLSSTVYELLVHSSVMVIEVTDFELNKKTKALSKNRVQQQCGGVGVGGGRSLAASRSLAIADQCSCGSSLGTDCACVVGDFICICITWRECTCAGGMCGDIQ